MATPKDPVTDWARKVVASKIVAGPHVRNTCRRHLLDLKRGPSRGLKWDPVAANRAINFFPEVLRLNGGQFEGRPFQLDPSQAFRVGSLFGWKRQDGTRRFRRFYDEEGKGNGKAVSLDTPIPTPSGWTTMGALVVGDQVFDEYGAPCRVTAATDVMIGRPCFAVQFNDGDRIVADADHIWRTSALLTRGRKGPKPADAPRKYQPALRTTAEIARTVAMPPSTSRHPQARWNHRVEIAGALQLPEADLLVPPYSLGVWLGDGNTDDARFTLGTRDLEILDHMAAEGVAVQAFATDRETAKRFGLVSSTVPASTGRLSNDLRQLGLIGNKHIPAAYFRASVGQRMALLNGLMDTDGTISKIGAIEITLTKKRLAFDVVELLRTLGFKPSVTESAAMLRGVEVSRRWRIQFWAYEGDPVFRLARHVARLRSRPATRRLSQGRMIVGCDPVPSVPVRCIAVDSPSHMYLCGRHYVPTHNSPMLAGIGLYCMLADKEARAEIYAAGSKKDQAMVLFRDAVAMVDQSPSLKRRLTKSGSNPVWNLADVKTGSFFRPISSDDGQSGPRPSCALCDEVHEHRNGTTVEMLERGFKSRRQPLLVMATNSGTNRNSVCWREHQHAVRVAAGTRTPDDVFAFVGEAIDDETFSFVCALDKGDNPLTDPKCWVKANPLLGVTVKHDYLAGVVRQAVAIPGKLNGILRLHFCVWTDAEEAWISRAALEACLAEFDPLEEHAGKDIVGGLDLSGSQDLTAAAFATETGTVAVDRDGESVELPTYDLWLEAWTPADTLAERALRDQAPYEQWRDDGWLHAESGKTVRLDFVAHRIGEVATDFRLVLLAYDRYAYRRLEDEFDEQGLTIDSVEHPQGGKRRARPTPEQIEDARRNGEEPPEGLWMPGSVTAFETLVLEGRIRIRASPVIISAIMSVALEADPFDNRWLSKRKAVNRIDAAVAAVMAIGAITATARASSKSPYADKDLLIL